MDANVDLIKIRVLVLEDNSRDAEINIRELRKAGYDPEWTRVQTEKDFLAALEKPPDLILSDFAMPQFDGIRAVELLRERGLDTPFILISGTLGEEAAVKSIKRGADDYFLKQNLTRLGAAAVAALDSKRLRDEHRAAAEEKRRNDERLLQMAQTQAAILDALPAHIALLDNAGIIVAVNESWRRFASANILQSNDFFVGQNYLGVCENAHGECTDEAGVVAAGIRQVLSGESSHFSMEYPCHSPTEKRWFRLMVTPLNETHRAGVVVMHINVTERREAEEALKAREREQRLLAEELTIETRRLQESQEVAHVGSWETDLDTLKVTWTDETHRIFETDPDTFKPTHQVFLEFVHPDDRAPVEDAFKRSLGKHGPFSIEHRIVLARGNVKVVEERWATYCDSTGKPARALGTCQDITVRKLAEEAVKESEARFRGTFEQAAVGIAHVSTDLRYLRVNDKLCDTTGYTRDELLRMSVSNLALPEDAHIGIDARDAMLSGVTSSSTFQKRYVRKNGEIIWVNIVSTLERDTKGNPNYFISVIEDITSRKLAEQRLAKLNRLYLVLSRINEEIVRAQDAQTLFDATCRIAVEHGMFRMAAIMRVEPGTGAVRPMAHFGVEDGYFSEVSVNILDAQTNRGTIGTAILGKRHDVCNDMQNDPRMAVWSASFARRGYRSTASFSIRAEGFFIGAFVLFSDAPDFFQEDEIKLLKSVAENISFALDAQKKVQERDCAEEAVRESETRFRALFEQAAVGMSVKTIGGRFHRVNRRFCEIVGYTENELMPLSGKDITHPDDWAREEKILAHMLAGEIQTSNWEKRYIHKAGGIVWCNFTLSMLPGNPPRFVSVIQDISGQKRATEERDRLFNFSLDMLCVASFEGRFEQVNPAWTVSLGWSAEELTSRPWMEFVHPQDHAATIAAGGQVLQGVSIRDFENRYHCKDGSYRWLSWSVLPLMASRQIFAVVRDVTERRERDAQLRLLETCVSRLNDIVLITEAEPIDEPGPRILYANDAFVRLTGFSREEALGKSPRLLQGPKTQREALERIRTALKAGKPIREELINYTKSGDEYWIELDIVPVADATGRFTHRIAIERDISERKKAEAEALRAAESLAEIVKIQQEIASSILPLDGIMTVMAERASQLTGAACGVVELAIGDEMVYRAASGTARDKVGLRVKRTGSLAGLALDTNSVLSCDDSETDPRVDLQACRKVGVRSMVVAPLRVGEQTLGVLKVISAQPGAFTKRDVNNLQILVESLGGVIQRQRAADALRASAEEFRNLAEVMPQIVWVTRPDGWTIYFNQVWMTYTGLTLEESLGEVWNTLIHPEDQKLAWDAWQLATSTVGTYVLEYRLRRADGEFRWFLVRGAPQRDAGGNVLKWFGTCTDIHELKQAGLEIARTNRALKMLSSCNESLIRAEKERGLLEAICKIAVEIGGYRMAWVGYVSDDEAGTIKPVAHSGIEEGYLSEIQLPSRPKGPNTGGPAARALRTGQAAVCEDIETDPGFQSVAAARKRGYRGVTCLPLCEGGGTFGILALYSSEVRHSSREELDLLQELADDLAFGIVTLRVRAKHQKAVESLRESEERFRQLAENINEVFWMLDPVKDESIYISPAFEKIWGRSCQSAITNSREWTETIHPDDRAQVLLARKMSLQDDATFDTTYRILRPDGSIRWIHDRAYPIRNEAGEIFRVVGTASDITTTRNLEEQFRQSQKMEAFGLLAGGVAHDFNNLLGVVIGYCDIWLMKLPQDAPIRSALKTIKKAGDRASALTKQLLAFSRQTVLDPKVLDLNDVVKDTEKILERLIGEDIELTTVLDPSIPRIKVDPGQIGQVLINLAVNARDAMPTGGTLTIETRTVNFDEAYVNAHPGSRPGSQVMLAVSDTGCGIPPEILARIFEPFFTTKGVGKGTGLGLAVVHGVITQSGGSIQVESTVGVGTTFRLYFPVTMEVPNSARHSEDPASHAGIETILVVEDEESLRDMAAECLRSNGYNVLTAESGKHAEQVLGRYEGIVDLMLTDVVMPGMSGRQLVESLKPKFPSMKVVFMSGYTDDSVVRHGVRHEDVPFLQKPFTPFELMKKVRGELDKN